MIINTILTVTLAILLVIILILVLRAKKLKKITDETLNSFAKIEYSKGKVEAIIKPS